MIARALRNNLSWQFSFSSGSCSLTSSKEVKISSQHTERVNDAQIDDWFACTLSGLASAADCPSFGP
jgi:hypothetical protein